MPSIPYPMVLLIWDDAHSEAEGWLLPSELNEQPRKIYTVGWLLADAKAGHVVVAQSYDDDSAHVDSVLCVPVAMVVSLKVLA